MQLKLEINNSKSYEYLIHGQDLHIEFEISNALFTIVNYKQLHTRVWFHKLFSSIYYVAPFYRFYNFLINKNIPGFRNRKLVATNFEYPGTSYKFRSRFVPKCILDNKIKIRSNKGFINTSANHHYSKIIFIGIGFGFKIFKKQLVVKIIDLKEEETTIKNKVEYPTILKDLIKLNAVTPVFTISQNSISLNKSNFDIKTTQQKIIINKSIFNINHFIEN
jgi:hypothetical protein